MKVYVLLLENGDIHSIHGNRLKAIRKKEELEKLYAEAVIKELEIE